MRHTHNRPLNDDEVVPHMAVHHHGYPDDGRVVPVEEYAAIVHRDDHAYLAGALRKGAYDGSGIRERGPGHYGYEREAPAVQTLREIQQAAQRDSGHEAWHSGERIAPTGFGMHRIDEEPSGGV